MTTYRLFPSTSGPGSPTAYAGNFLAGIYFTPTTKLMWFQGYYFWCPTGGDTGAQKFALWNRYGSSAQVVVSGSVVTSGTLTAGAWNYVPLATPVQLAPGALYCAATGWTSVNGFPVTNNQFGAAQPFASGIVNGPLTAWSDPSGSNNYPTPGFETAQGVFSTAGTDPSVNMPQAGSNQANFWMDVSLSDTAPSGYGGTYRFWPNQGDIGNYALDTANNFTLGLEFSASKAVKVNNIWFYSPATVTQLPTEIAIYNVSGPTLVASNAAPSWSGAVATGWIKAAMGGNVTLTPGNNYKACVLNAAGTPAIWNGATSNYWSTGFGGSGLTAGPLTAPNNAGASPGQESYNLGAALAYPNTNAGPFHYGVDIEVTPVAGGSNLLAASFP